MSLFNIFKKKEKKETQSLDQLIEKMMDAGMTDDEIEAALKKDLHGEGQIFGDFRKNFKSQMRYSPEEVARGAIFEKNPEIKLWDWKAIADKELCDDCAKRSQMGAKPLDFWRSIGLPGAGTTVCQFDCRCALADS